MPSKPTHGYRFFSTEPGRIADTRLEVWYENTGLPHPWNRITASVPVSDAEVVALQKPGAARVFLPLLAQARRLALDLLAIRKQELGPCL